MELKQKLKELRTSRRLTQEEVAEALGVSAQTVSKWERGLLSPDIYLLPKIALLYRCSIDSLFDMSRLWSNEHQREFEARVHELHAKRDWEGVYQACITEIELNPDTYKNYPDVMLHVYRKKLYDNGRIERMISLADYAEKHCQSSDIRNEIYKIMLQICADSDDEHIKSKADYYYKKLPSLRHSREIYAKCVMTGDEYRSQLKKNLIQLVDMAECTVRQLISPDMPLDVRLEYYKKAAALYEIVLDNKYAGFFDPPLLTDYCEIAAIYIRLRQRGRAGEYIERIVTAIERHMNVSREKSELLYSPLLPNATPTEKIIVSLFRYMINKPELDEYKAELSELQRSYENLIAKKEATQCQKNN